VKNFSFKNLKYIEIILAVVTGYILLKLVDNLQMILNGLSIAYNIVSPFIFALIIAYMLNPLVKFLEKNLKLNRSLSILSSYVIVLGVLFLSSLYIFPKLYDNILDLINKIPTISRSIQQQFNDFIQKQQVTDLMNSGIIDINPNLIIPKISSFTVDSLTALISTAVSFTNYFIKLIFGFLIAIYVLFDKERIIDFSKKLIYIILKKKHGDKFLEVISNLNSMIGTYIGIKAIDSLIIGTLAFIGLLIIGSDYVFLLSVIVGLTNMIPYFGPFIGIAAGVLINIFSNLPTALIVAGFLLLLQQFDNWILDPKLIGDKVGLSPLLVMLAVTIGGGYYGIIGMILAVPLMAVIKIYVTKFMDEYDFSFLNNDSKKDVLDK
jgi:predicted PurR-regulated permease PerM